MEKKDTKEKIFSDLTAMSGSHILFSIISAIRGTIVAKILAPPLYGLINIFNILLFYSRYASLGITKASRRKVPYYLGQEDFKKADLIQNTNFNITIILVIFYALAISSWGVFFGKTNFVKYGLFLTATLVIVTKLYQCFTFVATTRKKFILLSKINVLDSIIQFILVILFIYLAGVYGYLTGLIFSLLILIFLIKRNINLNYRFVINSKELGRLIKIGIPMLLGGLAFTGLRTADKIMIAKYLGTTKLAYYGLAAFFTNFLLTARDNLTRVMGPRFHEQYGKTQSALSLQSFVFKPTEVMAFLFPCIMVIVVLSIHVPIRFILPKYIPSIDIIRLLIFNFYFQSLTGMPIIFLYALNKQNETMMMLFSTLILNIFLNYLFIKAGLDIVGVAISTVISNAFLCLILFIRISTFFFVNVLDAIKYYLKLFSPFLYALLLLWIIVLIGGYESSNMRILSLQVISFVLLYSPVFYYIHKRTQVFNLIKAFIGKLYFR